MQQNKSKLKNTYRIKETTGISKVMSLQKKIVRRIN